MNTAIVILNYLNYKDTIECTDSIIKMNYLLTGIVIVDNGSKNNSYHQLDLQYKDNEKVHLLRTSKNFGYAKGNNVGIIYALKELNADNIFVVNNDTVFTDPEYIEKLLRKSKPGVGVVDSKVKCKNGKYNPSIEVPTSLMGITIRYIRYCLEYIGIEGLTAFAIKFETKFGKLTSAPQGSALLFTHYFFKEYSGFYPETFLYCEEHILSLLLQKAGLKVVHAADTEIYHKEDMSSQMSFKNDSKKKRKLELESYKYVFKVRVMPLNKNRGVK